MMYVRKLVQRAQTNGIEVQLGEERGISMEGCKCFPPHLGFTEQTATL